MADGVEPGALRGTRVLDCSTGIAGPIAGMLLADFGADVVKVEPPGGDPARTRHAGFAVWNRNKRSVVADVATEVADAAGAAPIDELLAGADVCIASGPRSRLDGTVLGPGRVAAAHPRLVYVHVGPYLDDAPWLGGEESDPFLAASTGVSLRQASFEAGPVESIYPHLVTVQGLWAATAAVAALHERSSSGLGQVVNVTGLHAALIAAAGAFTFDGAAAPPPPAPRVGGPGGAVPFYRTYQCADGEWLFLAALTPRFTDRAFGALGVEWLWDEPRLEGGGRAAMLRPDNSAWAIEQIAAVFRQRKRDEWLGLLAEVGCPAGPLLDRDDWLDHPQLEAIGMRVEVDDPERGLVVMPGVPIRLSRGGGRVRAAAPRLGEHTDGAAWAPRDDPATAPPAVGDDGDDAAAGPLAGVRVLDLGAIIAGPFAASLLAELGADVIKVEPPTGDSFRGPGFAAYNKGQRGIVLDLQTPAGREALLALARDADVVIDNYRPGVLQRLRIAYDDLRTVNPGVITLSITGFGEGGPLGGEAGFDPVLQAMSGMMTAQGGDSDPVFFTVPVNDVTTATAAALAVCLALVHRDRTGEGQRCWASLAGTAAFLQAGELVRWAGRDQAPLGGRDHRGDLPLDGYHQVADGWVRLRVPDDVDPGPLARIGGMTRRDAVAHLTAAGIAAVAARTAPEIAAEPAVVAAEVLHRDPRPGRDTWWTPGRHVWFSRTQRDGTLVSPALGEHTEEVLADAGVDPDRR